MDKFTHIKRKRTGFFPEVDFTNPSTFVRYGSAERYYEDAITATYRMYPYDGSLKEKSAMAQLLLIF